MRAGYKIFENNIVSQIFKLLLARDIRRTIHNHSDISIERRVRQFGADNIVR